MQQIENLRYAPCLNRAMDFFAHQETARKRTTLLLVYYTFAVALLVLATYAAAMVCFAGGKHLSERRGKRTQWPQIENAGIWNAPVFGASSLFTLTVVGLGALWQTIALRRGGSAVAEMLGGRPVPLQPADDRERQLRNVIEEISIASGTPVPEIYLLEDERAINAFAAGHSPNDMAIGVTRGCMERLSRDELQGVIGHEFSHILNGDTRLNIRLMGVLHGILCLYIIGRVLLRVRSRSSRDKNPLPLFGLALILIGSAGLLFGRLIQAAVSRQREFLADASAVQFTRNPNGIAGALKKIGGFSEGSQLESPRADAASHFFFANGLAESWFGLTATHPPLDERIRRIDPAFDGKFPHAAPGEALDSYDEGMAQALASIVATKPPPTPPRVRADSIMQQVGQTIPIRYASGILESLPEFSRDITNNSWSATALVFAAVLNPLPQTRAAQLQILKTADARLAAEAERLGELLARSDRRARLPVISLCLPALRTLSPEQWRWASTLLDRLIGCDNQIDLFEFALKKIVERNVQGHFAPKAAAAIQYYSFGPLLSDCAVLLSALANVGSQNVDDIRTAFTKGFSQLPFSAAPALVPHSECGLQRIDTALTRLAQAVPHIKKVLLQACAETVACDGFVTADEAELLRAIAESLGCPIPPFIEGVA